MPRMISFIRIARYAVFSRIRAALRRAACAVLPLKEVSYSGPAPDGWQGWVEAPVFGTVAFINKDGAKHFRW